MRLTIAVADWSEAQSLGASISVNGACLTVVASQPGQFTVELMAETLAKTNLANLKVDDAVNLERAVTAATCLNGHIVQGHVDTTVAVTELKRAAGQCRMTCALSPALRSLLVPQGSLCLDGVSLTVAALESDNFTVVLIPYTMDHTTLGQKMAGARLNLETDIIGKYVARWMELRAVS